MSQLPPLRFGISRLLVGPPDAARPVAFDRRGERSHADLHRDVAALTARLAERGAAAGARWLLLPRDVYSAAVGLLALARCRAVAVLPPNRQNETIERLARGAAGALFDATSSPAEVAATADVPGLAVFGRAASEPAAPCALDPDAVVAEFQTSGTTGDARPVHKRLRHLEDEVVALEQRLGGDLEPATRVFATASHHHIYGLLFRLLWPLAAGRPFQSETLLHARELLPRMEECERAALVTTPVHLKRLTATGGLRAVRGICRAVYSSGGPLDPETAKAVAEQLGAAPVEVFGSTETGGVALRRRDVEGDDWEALPGVSLERCGGDGRLAVTSPYVSCGDEVSPGRVRAVMGDCIALAPGGGFRLLGRADRVVKIGEKRLSLPEMEAALEAHEWVEEAALLVLDKAGADRVHAVIAPSAAGRAELARVGRAELGAALASHLAARFDPVVLPRAWRTVDRLPRDPQDKVPHAALRELFASPTAGERPRDPSLLAERRGTDFLERDLEIPLDLAQLEGHFDAQPVVAGVVQLRWVMDAARAGFGDGGALVGVEALKFPRPLVPGRRVTLRIERGSRPGRLRFELVGDAAVHATGRLLFAEEPR